MSHIVVTNIEPNHRRMTRNDMIWMSHKCWCIIAIILADSYSTIILQASSFTIPTSTNFVHCSSPITTNNNYRCLESAFLQKRSDIMVTEEIMADDDGTVRNSNRNGQYKKERTALNFGAKLSYTSDPIPIPPSHKLLSSFFQQYHGILLRGGHDDNDNDDEAYPIEKISSTEIDSRLIRKWRSQCVAVNAPTPDLNRGDYVASVTTGGILFGGVEITPTSIVGVKLVLEDDKELTMMPEFQGVLISNETRAKGPWLIVSLFNKILYGGKNPADIDSVMKSGDNKISQTTSLTRVWAELIDDGGDDEQLFVFRAATFMKIKIYYPRTLSRLVPMGKGTVEKFVSAAIAKALEKNLYPAMEQFNLAYKDWIID